MKRMRWIAGLLLILLAIGAMFCWENFGRARFLYDSVLVAAEEIPAGTPLRSAVFRQIALPPEGKTEGSLSAAELSALADQVAARRIPAGSQLTAGDLQPLSAVIPEGSAIFPLKAQWISARSSALRGGDLVELVENVHYSSLGVYRVAFVKDSAEQEVVNSSGLPERNWLRRADGSGIISHIEIVAALSDYQRIRACTEGGDYAGLILVQKEEKEE